MKQIGNWNRSWKHFHPLMIADLIVFLKYFEDWLESFNSRPGKIFLCWQICEGIKITLYSVIELV